MREFYFSEEYEWVRKLDPRKRIFKGEAYNRVKRLMDLCVTLLAMPAWLPIVAVVAFLIKLSSPKDPVLFSQLRTGKGGRRFKMLKFRTMVANAESMKGQFAKLNASGELAGPLKLKDDPRVTKLGRILRKTSLDEFPQFFNVLRGEMSLVGPRPTSWSANAYKLWQTERLEVMPGIFGLWQIYGRGSQDFDEWLRLDILYIDRRSIWLDVMLLIYSVLVVFRQRGAR